MEAGLLHYLLDVCYTLNVSSSLCASEKVPLHASACLPVFSPSLADTVSPGLSDWTMSMILFHLQAVGHWIQDAFLPLFWFPSSSSGTQQRPDSTRVYCPLPSGWSLFPRALNIEAICSLCSPDIGEEKSSKFHTFLVAAAALPPAGLHSKRAFSGVSTTLKCSHERPVRFRRSLAVQWLFRSSAAGHSIWSSLKSFYWNFLNRLNDIQWHLLQVSNCSHSVSPEKCLHFHRCQTSSSSWDISSLMGPSKATDQRVVQCFVAVRPKQKSEVIPLNFLTGCLLQDS